MSESALRRNDLTLQSTHLLRGDLAAFKRSCRLLLCIPQQTELFSCLRNLLREDLLFLRQKFRIRFIKFQQAVDLSKFRGKRTRLLIRGIERLAEICGIAADLDSQSLDNLIRHSVRPPSA